ncbi:MAG: hypothetical protein K1X94_09680 [Sandaracinaceae bacterium]|nr:hypothetical protein [Sandaracinaceae bacterium]
MQPFEGGVVALVSASDGSRRSIIRIAADGTVVHAPREFGMGTPIDLDAEPAFSTALAADERGFTVALAVGSDATPIRVTRYDWTGFQQYTTLFTDTRSTDVLLLARPDTVGGTYVLLLGTRRTSYQHVDAFGRLAGFRRTMSCPSGLNVEENVLYDRESLDGGIARGSGDAGPSSDADDTGEIDGGVR